MPTVLITGSNRGIGLEFVRQYASDNWHVLATCRNPINVGTLANLPGNIEIHGLDVNNEIQLKKLAEEIKDLALDVVINNAGIYGGLPQTFTTCKVEDWLNVFRTNTIAPLSICKHFLPNLSKTNGKIVTISSKMGSISDNSSGGMYIYRSTKAALNSVMKSLAIDLYPKSIAVCTLHPGWVQTEMGGENALINTRTSVNALRRVIESLTLSDSGKFYNYDGSEINW